MKRAVPSVKPIDRPLADCDEKGCHRIAMWEVRFENGSSSSLCVPHVEQHGHFIGRLRPVRFP